MRAPSNANAQLFDFDDEDTEVSDVPLEQPLLVPIARPRVETRDLVVHVCTDDGRWHRLHPSTTKTACGIPVNYYRSVNRAGRYPEHPLGRCQCWTDEERKEADDAWLTKFPGVPLP